jgi:hypothetical protein
MLPPPPPKTNKVLYVANNADGSKTARIAFTTADGRDAVGDTMVSFTAGGIIWGTGSYGVTTADPANTATSKTFYANVITNERFTQTGPNKVTKIEIKNRSFVTLFVEDNPILVNDIPF